MIFYSKYLLSVYLLGIVIGIRYYIELNNLKLVLKWIEIIEKVGVFCLNSFVCEKYVLF